jgi:polyferredoxin
MCVQVCPTGIDIRQGLQYMCIGCAACVDACDSVMDKIDRPRGLIRYSTENAIEQGFSTRNPPPPVASAHPDLHRHPGRGDCLFAGSLWCARR